MKFNTPYQRVRQAPEKNNQLRKIEVAGYIPAKKRIENIINAGMRLMEARSNQYDFPDGNDDGFSMDPTRKKGYDMADATQAYHELQAKLELKRMASIEASKKAQAEKNTKVSKEEKKASTEA